MADDDSSGSGWSSSTGAGDGRDASKSSGIGNAIRNAAGGLAGGLMGYGRDQQAKAADTRITPVQYHRGGKVRKTGPAILKRGERVIPASKRKAVERSMKREGVSLTNKKRGKGRRSAGR